MRKNKITKATKVVSAIVVLFFLCLGGVTVMFKGFIDFPCFVNYDEVNGCIVASDGYPEVDEEKHIQVFLDVSRLGFGGAGCNAKSSFTDILEFDTPVTSLKFERQNDTLFVNGNQLAVGDQFTFTNYWTLNPWTVEKIEFKNYGNLPVCGSSKPPQTYVIGSYRNQVSLVKALLSLAFCLLVIYLMTSKVKRKDIAG